MLQLFYKTGESKNNSTRLKVKRGSAGGKKNSSLSPSPFCMNFETFFTHSSAVYFLFYASCTLYRSLGMFSRLLNFSAKAHRGVRFSPSSRNPDRMNVQIEKNTPVPSRPVPPTHTHLLLLLNQRDKRMHLHSEV